ncbi:MULTISPECIES: hypothetical protein [Bradyrhizobium]|jgi:hypothetical protein|uniref:hypothetical protein n=1 Tax=Bradyrhizobium TaxID=374 RepID=UPI00293E0134|nr:hypothetical protein [Bradyrhizobium sp. NDS-1]WOH71319.1 hypothetical protein RX330_23880 [Bradyrhizobium sp. NDS-1]
MWDLTLGEYDLAPDTPHLAQMRAELVGIGEKERILRERSADRETYRYLLDAHRLSARELSLRAGVEHFSAGREQGGQLWHD